MNTVCILDLIPSQGDAQVYDDAGDTIDGTLEGKALLKVAYMDVPRQRKGTVQTIDRWHVEINLKISAIDAVLKYFCIDQITKGKTPILPMIVGEVIDRETGNAEWVRITDIYLNPEELTLWEAKAEGNDKATYEIKGRSNKEPDFIDRLPNYVE